MKVLSIFFVLVFWGLLQAQNLPEAARRIGVDATKASIPIEAILSGGPPPQGIPALGFKGDWQGAAEASLEPKFIAQTEAENWLKANEPVILITIENEAKIYPLQILTWHEIVNDTLAGEPIAVSFCPLCNSSLAFDRRIPLSKEMQEPIRALNPEALFSEVSEPFYTAYRLQEGQNAELSALLEVSFGVSGMLYNSNMLMFDTKTSSLFSQLLGEATVGSLTGTRLLRLPAPIVSFAEAQSAYPDALVLSRDTGFQRRYGSNPYVGYDDIDSPAFLFKGIADGRLSPKERVISLDLAGESVAYPFSLLKQERVIQDANIVLFWQEGTATALGKATISEAEDIGSVGVFSRNLDGQELSFSWKDEQFSDNETGSSWNLLGQAISGPLQGQKLNPIVHDNTLWFAWAAFKPETRIFGLEQ